MELKVLLRTPEIVALSLEERRALLTMSVADANKKYNTLWPDDKVFDDLVVTAQEKYFLAFFDCYIQIMNDNIVLVMFFTAQFIYDQCITAFIK